MNVKISRGNSKMGSIPSVSLPAGVTCRCDCKCREKCYALKLERLRKNVRDCYKNNYDLLLSEPDTYWREVEASIMMSRFFRFHVSGDIPNSEYFSKMVEVAGRNHHCNILCFTKKFSIVNKYLECSGGELPVNLQIVFSGWKGMEMDNPFHLPEAHVIYKDGSTTARSDAKLCHGNCAECAITSDGCWSLRRGEQVAFGEH